MNINRKYSFEKIGIDEVVGLKAVLKELIKPVQSHIEENCSLIGSVKLDESEYKSRDGFIPYTSNCGGIEISVILPKQESYNFTCVDFGDCIDFDDNGNEIINGENHECDEHCDAKLRVWLKFEGFNDNGEMMFYLYAGGGNGDAPYFRTKYETTIFERDFTAKNLAELEKKGKTAINKLIKALI